MAGCFLISQETKRHALPKKTQAFRVHPESADCQQQELYPASGLQAMCCFLSEWKNQLSFLSGASCKGFSRAWEVKGVNRPRAASSAVRDVCGAPDELTSASVDLARAWQAPGVALLMLVRSLLCLSARACLLPDGERGRGELLPLRGFCACSGPQLSPQAEKQTWARVPVARERPGLWGLRRALLSACWG